jgi:F420-dependent oxidoreductase-like protein
VTGGTIALVTGHALLLDTDAKRGLMMAHPIRFGIQTGQQLIEWSDMLALWQKADRWGYDSLWNFDHFYPIFVDPEGPCLESWTTLSALAQATTRARIGTLVNGNTYRNPCLTAKMAASLDHISGGRLNLGIGAGWFELEHESFGVDYKTTLGRLEALDESCRILHGMFTQERTTFAGKHYSVKDVICSPKPLQKPKPPIMIGGTGEKVLLRLVARHADMWNAFESAERMGELIEILRRHADAEKRDADAIEKSVMIPLAYNAGREREEFVCALVAGMSQTSPDEARSRIMIGGKQECLDTIERYRGAGITHFIFMLFAPYFMEDLQGFAEEVMPAVR